MVTVRAPVRISFGGGGTDLEAYYGRFGGFVVSAAITRYAYVTARPSADGGIQIISADYRLREHYPPGLLPEVTEPLTLPKAAVERFAAQGLLEQGVDLFLASEVPPGTGLGSSSAMTVALVAALGAYLGLSFAPAELAEEASRLEIERLAMPIGKQDQYASAFGGLNALTFRDTGTEVRPLALAGGQRQALARRLLLFSTGSSRHSAEILRQQRSDTRRKPAVTAALHQLKELAAAMQAALEGGALDEFGALLDVAWQEKKRLSGKISNAGIDTAYQAARAAGALGGKITGAGGGGFLLLYCPPRRQSAVRAVMGELGLCELTFDLSRTGVEVVSGAVVDELPVPVPGD